MVEIKGIKWKIKLLTKEAYFKAYGPDQAHMEAGLKTMFFRKDIIKLNVVIHEVTHAYIAQCHLGSCNTLSIDDFEEIICELMEDHILDISKTGREVMKILKELK